MKTNESTSRIRCLICEKTVKGDTFMVLMATDGRMWTERNAPTLDIKDDQGWFEVGSDCYRKVNAAGQEGYRG